MSRPKTMRRAKQPSGTSSMAPAPAPVQVAVNPAEWEGKLKDVAGSRSDTFNTQLCDQVARTLWVANSSPEWREQQYGASIAAMVGAAPRDELEGMLIGQLIASHAAVMEAFRRGMLADQPMEARAMNLGMANKTSRTFAALLEALNRHRGKGQQTIKVEHVSVHAGGQAIVGVVDSQGGDRDGGKNAKRPHAKHIAHAPEPTLPSPDASGYALPAGSHEEWALPNARGNVDRRPDGKHTRLEARAVHSQGEGRAAEARRDDAGNAAADQDG